MKKILSILVITLFSLLTSFAYSEKNIYYNLNSAIHEKKLSKLKKIINKSNHIDFQSEKIIGGSILYHGVTSGDEKIVSYLVGLRGVDPNLISPLTNTTALSRAVVTNKYKIVRLLLGMKHIDPNLTPRNGYSPLYSAASNGRDDIVKELLKHKKTNINLTRVKEHGENKEIKGLTALGIASQKGYLKVVKSLLRHRDINPNTKEESFGKRTPLYSAVNKGHVDIVHELLAHQKIDPNLKGRRRTPLHLAIDKENFKIVEKLLAHKKIDPNFIPSSFMYSPLYNAVKKGDIKIIKALLEHKKIRPNLNIKDKQSPAYYAKKNNLSDILELLETYM